MTDPEEDGQQVIPGPRALEELESLRTQLFSQVSLPIQFPEPRPVLDLESRRGSEVRMFKHLHQQTVLHRENFCRGNQIKHLYLVDAYIDLAKSRNPLMPYLVARTMFELSAFLHEVSTRLVEAASLSEQNWRQAGEKFHGEIVRARFATGRGDFQGHTAC
jgi:hypothetical protein